MTRRWWKGAVLALVAVTFAFGGLACGGKHDEHKNGDQKEGEKDDDHKDEKKGG